MALHFNSVEHVAVADGIICNAEPLKGADNVHTEETRLYYKLQTVFRAQLPAVAIKQRASGTVTFWRIFFGHVVKVIVKQT